jgi:uncharacterized protein (TIGR02145 family)
MKTKMDMLKKIFIPVLFTSFAVLFITCSKDDNSLTNETNGKTTAVFDPDLTYGTLTDRDGNKYKTITIGTQTWMAENLRTTKYNDGSPIPNVEDESDWIDLTTGAYCNYFNALGLDTIATYGRLYNWYAVNDDLAPDGWHVATDADWTTLTDYLGGESVSGNKIREVGTTHFYSPNTDATNETGFTAVPGGYRGNNGIFGNFGYGSDWWSATADDADNAWGRGIHYGSGAISRDLSDKVVGFSVRCVKDI